MSKAPASRFRDEDDLRCELEQSAHGIVFVPVRHHSPACARHLRALIEELAPRRILIEAPVDFEPLIDVLNDAATQPPVAIVAFPGDPGSKEAGTAGVSYFPFCSHSPEYLALREAAERDIPVSFIDLPAGDRMLLRDETGDETGELDTPVSLTDERPFDLSDYVHALCQRTGMRDQNELWDHLFETRADGCDWRGFFHDVASYCAHVRAACDATTLERDGTRAREQQMTALIKQACKADGGGEGPVVVVTGGFHTPALIDGLTAKQARAKKGSARGAAYLIRYGFRQLDRLNGYAAGLPLPGYYHRLWCALEDGARGHGLWRGLTLDILLAFTEHMRAQQNAPAPTVAALNNAAEAALQLARLRGRPGPTREDLLDACRSTFLKGENFADTDPLITGLNTFLTGTALGNIPPSAGSPPLVEAARAQARRFGFSVDDGDGKTRKLDIYRKPRQRQASCFLHAMNLLGTGFGEKLGGPDFLSGIKLDVLFETWSYAWSPMVEARLIELAAMAETPADACVRLLQQRIAALEKEGKGRNAGEAVRLLLSGYQAGVEQHATQLLVLIEREVAADADFASVITALRELYLLWRARDVLGAAGSPAVEALIGVAYARALFLLPALREAPEDRLSEWLDALGSLREVIASAGAQTDVIDAALFHEAIGALLDAELHPALGGALAALAVLAGITDQDVLLRRLRGNLGGAFVDSADRVAFLRGVITISRELLWRVPGLAAACDDIIGSLQEDDFITLLPHLRLAFAALDPRETDRFALGIAERHGMAVTELSGGVNYTISAEQVQANLSVSRELLQALAEDGLSAFVEEVERE